MNEELKIIGADERIARSNSRTVKIGIFGEHGIGTCKESGEKYRLEAGVVRFLEV